jgi:uncharacterized protein (TIGR00251 family)
MNANTNSDCAWPVSRMSLMSVKLRVRATPNARRSEVIGWEDDPQAGRVLRVRVAAPPMEGEANEELRNFFAKSLGLPKSKVLLEKGGSSRFKSFEIPDGTVLPWHEPRPGG